LEGNGSDERGWTGFAMLDDDDAAQTQKLALPVAAAGPIAS
jgi:hypothetical protein